MLEALEIEVNILYITVVFTMIVKRRLVLGKCDLETVMVLGEFDGFPTFLQSKTNIFLRTNLVCVLSVE